MAGIPMQYALYYFAIGILLTLIAFAVNRDQVTSDNPHELELGVAFLLDVLLWPLVLLIAITKLIGQALKLILQR